MKDFVIFDVEEQKLVKVSVQKCNTLSIIDTVFELIDDNSWRVKIKDLKDKNKYIVDERDLIDLILYIDSEYKKLYTMGDL